MLPLLAITLAQAGLGALQAATSGRGEREKELDRYARQSPLYKGSKSVDDYYQEALNRYRENPYQSQQYQVGQKNIQRALASGLANLQDRRSAAAADKLFLAQSNALSNLGVQAESQKSQRFGQMGNAAQMKAGEEYKKFDINQMTPYNRMLQLKQYKAQAANDRYNTGLSMIGGAASNAAMGALYGGFDKVAKVPTESAKSVANVTGSPFGKYNTDFTKYGIGNTGFNSVLGRNYSLPKIGGLPITNNYPVIDNYFSPEY